jgi:hypothetical protein
LKAAPGCVFSLAQVPSLQIAGQGSAEHQKHDPIEKDAVILLKNMVESAWHKKYGNYFL